MSNPLFNMLGNNLPMGNMGAMLKQLNQFRSTLQSDPKAQVEQMLNTGQMTQAQFNQLSQMATQIQNLLK